MPTVNSIKHSTDDNTIVNIVETMFSQSMILQCSYYVHHSVALVNCFIDMFMNFKVTTYQYTEKFYDIDRFVIVI